MIPAGGQQVNVALVFECLAELTQPPRKLQGIFLPPQEVPDLFFKVTSAGNSEHFLLCCSSELIVCCDTSVSVECGKHRFTGLSKLLCKRNLSPESWGGVPGSQDPATLLLWVQLGAAPGGWSLTALRTLLPAVTPPVLQLRCWWEHPFSCFGPLEQRQLQQPEPSCSPSPAQASLAKTLEGATQQVPLASGE